MDIFEKIEQRERDEAKKVDTRTAKAWVVTTGLKYTERLYTYAAARRLAARFNRLHGTDVAYAVRFGKVALRGNERLAS